MTSKNSDNFRMWKFFLEGLKQESLDIKIIRTRLYVEQLMDVMIQERIEEWDAVLKTNPRFRDKKIILNELYDLSSLLNKNIQLINELRNIVAHNLNVEDQKEDIGEKIEEMDVPEDVDLPSGNPEKSWEYNNRGRFQNKAIHTVIELSKLDAEVFSSIKKEMVEEVTSGDFVEKAESGEMDIQEYVSDISRFDPE